MTVIPCCRRKLGSAAAPCPRVRVAAAGSMCSGEAATFGQLSATLSLHVLCIQLLGMLPCLASQDGAVLCRWVLAGCDMLQLVANKLSIAEWAQTLSQVRLACFAPRGIAAYASQTGPAQLHSRMSYFADQPGAAYHPSGNLCASHWF